MWHYEKLLKNKTQTKWHVMTKNDIKVSNITYTKQQQQAAIAKSNL